jgi:nicotinate-nucleotide adenylyltransferase
VKIGVYGGTFDPIHVAHLIIAEHARQELALDKLLIMPCSLPPHKEPGKTSAAQHRYQMVRLAIAGNPYLDVSDLEMQRKGKSFTVITLQALTKLYQLDASQLFLIIGADNLVDIRTWRKPEKIFSQSTVVVAVRPHYQPAEDLPAFARNYVHLQTPLMELSSTLVRNLVREKKSIKYLVPWAVEEYIEQNHLYS